MKKIEEQEPTAEERLVYFIRYNMTDAMKEVLNYAAKHVLMYMLVTSLALTLVFALSGGFARDSTDTANARSGLVLMKDNRTGCHYLSAKHGGITPRLNFDGNHICNGE